MNEILKIRHLSKSFGRKRVLEDFALTAEKGKVYGLLGRNGEGKTTLVRILMGMIPADAGTIEYQGRELGFSDAAYKRNVGCIPEDPFFYDWMSVRALLDFNRGFYPRWNADKAAAYLAKFGLEPCQKIRRMSRGMKLKLELVAALAAEPEFLVLDDPTSGLDVPTRQDFLKGIIGELAAAGTTVLFATHLVHELERVVERLGILHGGRLILEEDFETVKARTRRVSLSFDGSPPADLGLAGTLTEQRNGRHIESVVYPWSEALEARVAMLGAVRADIEPMALEDIFVGFVSKT